MESTIKLPKFDNEADEAEWWFANRDALSDAYAKAAKSGSFAGRARTSAFVAPSAMVELDAADAARARNQAAKRGLKYQAYLKMLLHQALDNEERIAS